MSIKELNYLNKELSKLTTLLEEKEAEIRILKGNILIVRSLVDRMEE